MSDAAVARAIEAVRAGGIVVLPTDTVYGLAADGRDEAAARALYRLKGRSEIQPTAVLAASLGELRGLLTLDDRSTAVAEALLPGPYTLVVPNPAGVLPWLCGPGAATLGLRVPRLPVPAAAVLEAVGVLVATSANRPGGPDPMRLADVPAEIRAGADALVDGGVLPGTPSTVLDLARDEPAVLREGAVPAHDALARVALALGR